MRPEQFDIAARVASRRGISVAEALYILYEIKGDEKVYFVDVRVGDKVYQMPIYTALSTKIISKD